jgi:RNA polymerase sigma-70 factor (ECF subfamily)
MPSGDARNSALPEWFEVHRERLRRMIRVYWDVRLNSRLDPSDVVQETLAEAARRMTEHPKELSGSVYPWLRSLAYERLIAMRRTHLMAQKRTVAAEVNEGLELPDGSFVKLVDRIAGHDSTPSQKLMKQENRLRVRSALTKLPQRDRGILVLRFLEQLSIKETADVIGISQAAVSTRVFRALQRLRDIMKSEASDDA